MHRRVPLPRADLPLPERLTRYGGIVVVPDGSLRVARAGVLTALAQSGDILWSQVLLDGRTLPKYHAAPVALQSGDVLITLRRRYVTVATHGQIRHRGLARHGEYLDDTGPSPNLTLDGALIVTMPGGDVAVVRGRRWEELGTFGYDIPPPAVYDDGSLAIAGYSYRGLCRVHLDGTIIWQTPLRDADLLPTINRRQVVAVGSLNDHLSAFFAPDGRQMGEYGRAACFAEYLDGGWIALSKSHIARLTEHGGVVWEHPIEEWDLWRRLPQPIVDRTGRVYSVTAAEEVVCFGADGTTLFALPLGASQLLGLSIIGEGMLACIADDELVVIA